MKRHVGLPLSLGAAAILLAPSAQAGASTKSAAPAPAVVGHVLTTFTNDSVVVLSADFTASTDPTGKTTLNFQCAVGTPDLVGVGCYQYLGPHTTDQYFVSGVSPAVAGSIVGEFDPANVVVCVELLDSSYPPACTTIVGSTAEPSG